MEIIMDFLYNYNPGILAFILFFIMLALNFPVALAVGGAALATMFVYDLGVVSSVQTMSGQLDSFPLLATPLFILAGALLTKTEISKHLVNLAQNVLGNFPGGLAITAIISGALLGSMSGSNVATVGALSFLIFAMIEADYPAPFAVSVVAAGCTFGVVIPPSMGLIIYGVITETSIPKLFAAGMAAGLVMLAVLITYIIIVSIKNGYRGADTERSWASFIRLFRTAFWGLLSPVIILGSIYTGICTPTEAAAIAIVYILAIDYFYYKKISWKQLPTVFADASHTIGVVCLLIVTASVFARILTAEGLAEQIAQALIHISQGSTVLLLLSMNFIMVICGAFIEPVAIMYMLLPIFEPALVANNIDLLHFGNIMSVNLSMAHLTPPVGLSLYLASQISGVPFTKVSRAVIPFIGCEVIVIMIISFVPEISLYFTRFIG